MRILLNCEGTYKGRENILVVNEEVAHKTPSRCTKIIEYRDLEKKNCTALSISGKNLCRFRRKELEHRR